MGAATLWEAVHALPLIPRPDPIRDEFVWPAEPMVGKLAGEDVLGFADAATGQCKRINCALANHLASVAHARLPCMGREMIMRVNAQESFKLHVTQDLLYICMDLRRATAALLKLIAVWSG